MLGNGSSQMNRLSNSRKGSSIRQEGSGPQTSMVNQDQDLSLQAVMNIGAKPKISLLMGLNVILSEDEEEDSDKEEAITVK